MRSYNESELIALANPIKDGQWKIKKIPGIEKSGVLDPKVLERVEKSMAKKSENEIYPDIDLLTNRLSMGGANEDLTPEGSVVVTHKVIPILQHQIALTIFTKKDTQAALRKPMLFLHGGGFLGGTVKALNNQLKLLAFLSDQVVFSIDYRLAPENPFPAAIEDVLETVAYLVGEREQYQIDCEAFSIGGESAGATLALDAVLEKPDFFEKLVLVYPGVTMEVDTPNREQWITKHFDMAKEQEKQIRHRINRFVDLSILAPKLYCTDDEVRNPLVSPLYSDELAVLPNTLIVLPEFDPLTCYTEKMIEKLTESKVNYQVIKYLGMDHGFFDRLGANAQTEDLIKEMSEFLS